MDVLDQQHRLVAALSRLTRAGKARWARRPIEPQFAFCLAGDELIRFELIQGQQDYSPSEQVAGTHGVLGNVSFLWLEGLAGWDELLALIEAAPVSDDEYAAIVGPAHAAVLRRIEELDSTDSDA